MNQQPNIPGLLVAGATVECGCDELPAMLAKIEAEHLHVLRMDVITKPSQGYRLTLTRCGCDLCIEREAHGEPVRITGKESLSSPSEARNLCTPTNPYVSPKVEKTGNTPSDTPIRP